jgi:aminoglycoside 6'-N-acetyltransferase
MVRRPYEFRAMTTGDLPTIQRWLATPHVAQWWGDPSQQLVLVSEDLSHPSMQQFAVEWGDRPFAYIQCYDPAAWRDHGFGALPHGTRGIDQFIGEPEMVNCGHGSSFIRVFVEDLLQSGTPRVLSDPDPGNTRAIKAYEKAGFRRDRRMSTPDGDALLMVREL